MDQKEFATFAAALKTFYPGSGIMPNSKAVSLWYNQLKDLDYKIAEMALNAWVATEKFPPKISEIREKYNLLSGNEIEDWGAGWEQVQKAIHYKGMYREQEALDSFDEITRQCVKRLGYQSLCTSENVAADRANFRDIYKTLQERAKKSQILSINMKKAQENLLKGVVKDE